MMSQNRMVLVLSLKAGMRWYGKFWTSTRETRAWRKTTHYRTWAKPHCPFVNDYPWAALLSLSPLVLPTRWRWPKSSAITEALPPPERPQIELHSWGSCSSTKGGEDSGGDAKNILREVIVRHTRVWRCGTDKYTDMVGVGTQVGLWLGFVNVGYWVWLRVIVWACLCACI